jgi:hypothetical protein
MVSGVIEVAHFHNSHCVLHLSLAINTFKKLSNFTKFLKEKIGTSTQVSNLQI